MLNKLAAAAAACLLTANIAAAGTAQRNERKDFQVLKDVATAIDRYVHFTIFDDVSANVKDGVVTLTGTVGSPAEKTRALDLAGKVENVTRVEDKLTVRR